MKLDKIIAVRNSKTVFRDGDNCIKLFNSDYSKTDVLNEALNQARIEETGLNIPKIRDVLTINGKWAIVSDYIKGKTLDIIINENPHDKDKYLEDFVNLQMKIHKKRCPFLNNIKGKIHSNIDISSLDSSTKSKLSMRLDEMPNHNNVCHGDFNPSNIIIDINNNPYIIDWAHVSTGNASADVAESYLSFRFEGDTDGAEKYLDLFCKKSCTDMSYVRKWMPIVAASQLIKSNEKKREFLLSWAKIVDYK